MKPTEDKMSTLSLLADHIEEEFNLPLAYISGGNSANYNWFIASEDIGTINNIRIGESIFLGCERSVETRIPNLFTNVFTFVAEVIESKIKGSLPDGDRGQNAFGISPNSKTEGRLEE